MWTLEQLKYLEKTVGGKTLLEDDVWAWDLVNSDLKTDLFDDAKDFAKKLLDDVDSGDFTVEDIYNKYAVLGW